MKNKLLALLIVAAILCWTVGALAVNQPVENASETVAQEDCAESAEESSSDQHRYAQSGATGTWYANNTVGVLGLSLSEVCPGLTNKWYNIVPVELTAEGRQTVHLVASGMYQFGKAVIDVADGEVTVTYSFPEGLSYLQDECLQWFTSLDQITTDFLENPVGEYAFGEPVNIEKQLNDQDVALLFICNHVTYRQPITYEGALLTRYYAGLPEWVEWRAELAVLIEKMEAQAAERAAAEATATDIEATATDVEAPETDPDAVEDEESAA